ncbi:MAG: PDZ domain-containing protein, partial [Gemmatimonadaceae bacterium]|nr:PDZ domain-containing protein [Gemmatimonadaceae bacterium]
VMARTTTARAVQHISDLQAAMPRGWIGIVAEGAGGLPRVERGEMIIRYYSYPRIVSVDPSSPAQRAGLAQSDTLLAYDGRDVRENDISLTRLLRPNATIRVRVKRDGRVREVPVVVAEVPQRVAVRRDGEIRMIRATGMSAGTEMLMEGPTFPRAPSAPLPAMPRIAVRMPSAPSAPAPPSALSFSFSVGGVAGAQLTTITEGLARTVGVRYGVLVTSAPEGSPANESGLRDGDVIVKIAGQPVRTVPEVRSLVGITSSNGEHEVELEIVRERRTRSVVLRW